MARRAFYSFHYDADNWRAAQVRSMGVIEGNTPASDNDWESVKRGGDAAIERWIQGQLNGTSCAIVLIGSQTAGRKWIEYEIKESWNQRKGLLGIHIHGLKDRNGRQSVQGQNPFSGFNVNGTLLTSIVHAYVPPYSDSQQVYAHINGNLSDWIETAIAIRGRY
ncbi:MAG: TIR domain-containing protein [Planctomycetia bacterium]|nr:TIR domain-containing protein [Planctomycetia bacterium]